MEVCVPFDTSAGQDISSNSGSVTDPLNRTRYNSRDLSLKALRTCFTRYLNIEDTEISNAGCNLSPKKNDIVNAVREGGLNDSEKSNSIISASDKCLSKCSPFPSVGEAKSSVDGSLSGRKKLQDDKTTNVSEINSCAESVDEFCSQSISPPLLSFQTPLKLVSAMKGSREKPTKLSVTWAPDVYDPIPTSVSHVPLSKNHHYGKKYGKNKQKGGSSKSSRAKSKDKKQNRKSSSRSSSTTKFKLYDDTGVLGFTEPKAAGLVGYNVVSSDLDPFCGSSFLEKSVSRLHYAVTEAT